MWKSGKGATTRAPVGVNNVELATFSDYGYQIYLIQPNLLIYVEPIKYNSHKRGCIQIFLWMEAQMFLQSVHNWSQKKQVFHSLSLHQNPQWFWYFPLVILQPENVEDKFVEHLKPAILDKLFFRWFWFWIFGSPEIGLFCIGNHNTEVVYRFADETRPNSSCFWKATPLDNCNYTFYTHTHKSDED